MKHLILLVRELLLAYENLPLVQNSGTTKIKFNRVGICHTIATCFVEVDGDGQVHYAIFQTSGHYVLDRAAMASVQNWVFEPGMRSDTKVEMWVKVPIRLQFKVNSKSH